MRPRGSGHIVNVASMAGKTGFPNLATYSATKFGVVGLSESAHFELRGTGLEVSCVMPGVVDTELSTGLRSARGVKAITAELVAEEVVRALKVPRFDVFVPRSAGRVAQLAAMLPRRAREALGRAIKADQAATHADPRQREAYESRAAASAPAAEKVVEVQQQPAEERSAA
jgi:short-subunit dehydrogenase